jgi:hypothetical protein
MDWIRAQHHGLGAHSGPTCDFDFPPSTRPMEVRSTSQTSGGLAEAIFLFDGRLIHLPCASSSQTATAPARAASLSPAARQRRRRRLPLQAPRCCPLPLPFPSPPGLLGLRVHTDLPFSSRTHLLVDLLGLVAFRARFRAFAPAAAARGARSGTRLAWKSKRSAPRTSLELCSIRIFFRVHVAARFRFFLFRWLGESWLTPGPYLEPDLVGLLPWLMSCSILKVMRHVNRKLATELEIIYLLAVLEYYFSRFF